MTTPVATIETPAEQLGEHLLAEGREHLAAGRHREALEVLQRASGELPLVPHVYELLADAMQGLGLDADAMSARMGADAIARCAPIDLYHIGRVYSKHEHWDAAGYWYQRALMMDRDFIAAHVSMAWAMRQTDRRGEANRYTENAYRLKSFFQEQHRPTQRRTVLVLVSAQAGNVPFHRLLPSDINHLVRWVIEFGVVGGELPPYDVVFNAIGEADLGARSREATQAFMLEVAKPVLNPADRIDMTTRDQIPRLLDGIKDILVPPTIRWDRCGAATVDPHAIIAAAGIPYPAIVRPVGTHGGEDILLLRSNRDAAKPASAEEYYLTAYCEYQSSDGYFRKYRVIFIDREPYPYHLAIGSQWVLHYQTADMPGTPWKLEEERRFLEDPVAALGAAAWEALRAIGLRMDLDYCGIDFSLLPDGRVLVFETNATMLVHPEEAGSPLEFKNPFVQRIYDAFDRLLDLRIAEGTVASPRAGRREGV